jgi:hypothetical protein
MHPSNYKAVFAKFRIECAKPPFKAPPGYEAPPRLSVRGPLNAGPGRWLSRAQCACVRSCMCVLPHVRGAGPCVCQLGPLRSLHRRACAQDGNVRPNPPVAAGRCHPSFGMHFLGRTVTWLLPRCRDVGMIRLHRATRASKMISRGAKTVDYRRPCWVERIPRKLARRKKQAAGAGKGRSCKKCSA